MLARFRGAWLEAPFGSFVILKVCGRVRIRLTLHLRLILLETGTPLHPRVRPRLLHNSEVPLFYTPQPPCPPTPAPLPPKRTSPTPPQPLAAQPPTPSPDAPPQPPLVSCGSRSCCKAARRRASRCRASEPRTRPGRGGNHRVRVLGAKRRDPEDPPSRRARFFWWGSFHFSHSAGNQEDLSGPPALAMRLLFLRETLPLQMAAFRLGLSLAKCQLCFLAFLEHHTTCYHLQKKTSHPMGSHQSKR